MRATPSSILPRLAAVASIVASSAGLASAYDAEAIGDNLQPYIGGWVGMYQVNTQDLEGYVSGRAEEPKLDLFWPAAPAGGVSLGVAYGRVHMGANLGYQMVNGGKISAAKRATYGLHEQFNYDVIPLDFNLDLAMLPNEYPINFLVGGSVGVGFVRIQNPLMQLSSMAINDSGRIISTTIEPKSNDYETNSFLMATGFVGARINLARRLNLEGQVGWRVLKTDQIVSEKGSDPYRIADITYKGVGTGDPSRDTVVAYTTEPISVDLSGAYARVDLRWTFASKAEKERSAAMLRRRQALERIGQVALAAPRD